jgi:hypothetical protein
MQPAGIRAVVSYGHRTGSADHLYNLFKIVVKTAWYSLFIAEIYCCCFYFPMFIGHGQWTPSVVFATSLLPFPDAVALWRYIYTVDYISFAYAFAMYGKQNG